MLSGRSHLHLFLSVLVIVFTGAQTLGNAKGKRWAVLVAGANGYSNYRHQADVCHAYQVMKKGGLEDENIVVFMYDDIAFNPLNPRPGIIINKPDGGDVYQGVPKDYTGDAVNTNNFYAVILGNKTALNGGSGKVVDSGPDDRIFIYYVDHGAPGLLGMPSGDFLYARDFIDVLRRKHKANAYKAMMIYVEACESGSIFEGILPSNLNIYAMTASNAHESSWATYCPKDYPSPPSLYDTCIGDTFSNAWMEDSEIHDMGKETLEEQYKVVRRRTAVENFFQEASHVMRYGTLKFQKNFLNSFIGNNPENINMTSANGIHPRSSDFRFSTRSINQRDARLFHFQQMLRGAPKGSKDEVDARKNLLDELSRRENVDASIRNISGTLFGETDGSAVLNSIRRAGQPLVDDWDCFKTLTRSFREHCDRTSSRYGLRHTRVLANMCNEGSSEVEKVVILIRDLCGWKRGRD